MLPLLLALSVAAAPPGYSVSKKDVHGCELSLGPVQADGVRPMRAECRWPEVTPERFAAVVGDWAAHADIFESVTTSRVVEPGARAVVHQVHRNGGIADRELMVSMWNESVDGWDRYAWTLSDRAFTPADGNVKTLRNDGFWEARPLPGGGVEVRHALEYAPGGSVPNWIVRMFQTGGLEASCKDMRAALGGH